MPTSIKDIQSAYDECKSLRALSKKFGVSTYVVCRALCTAGIYPTETAKEVHRLLSADYTTADICASRQVKHNAISKYMPYRKGSYALSHQDTKNALAIRKFRKKERRPYEKNPE